MKTDQRTTSEKNLFRFNLKEGGKNLGLREKGTAISGKKRVASIMFESKGKRDSSMGEEIAHLTGKSRLPKEMLRWGKRKITCSPAPVQQESTRREKKRFLPPGKEEASLHYDTTRRRVYIRRKKADALGGNEGKGKNDAFDEHRRENIDSGYRGGRCGKEKGSSRYPGSRRKKKIRYVTTTEELLEKQGGSGENRGRPGVHC